ncbi:hypothetical protein GCM10009647_032680 [Streptomyces sanglieri]
MQIVLVVARRIDVDDQVQVVDVDAARRDVRRDQHRDLPVLEPVQGTGALRLGLAAVQRGGPHPAAEQMAGELVHGVLGVQEHEHPALAGRDLGRGGVLVRALHVEHVVLHRGHRTGRRVDRVDHRVVQVIPYQQVDVTVQGRREQHPLALRQHLVEQVGDLRHESHVGHLVGLVEDGDGDPVQPAVAAVDEVLEPAGRGDDDLGAGAQRGGLPADRHAADDGGHPQPERAGVRGERVGDLLGQFPGGDEDQGQRAAGVGPVARDPGQQGQTEGEGLAGAGPAAPQHVAPREGVRQGGRLDRERRGDALGGERREQRLGQVQFREGGNGGQRRSDGLRQCELALYGGGPAAAGAGAGIAVVRTCCAIAVHAGPFLDGARIEEFAAAAGGAGIARTGR